MAENKINKKKHVKVPQIRFNGYSDDWKERKLGELMEITSVKRIHQSDWTNNGIRFLRARDIVSASKGEEPSDYLYISEEKYEEYSKVSGKVQIGDLLVTGVGTIGVPMLVIHNDPLYFKDGNIIWFKNQSTMDGNFFYYSFIGMRIQKYIRDVAGIGTVGTYTIDSGKKTPISLPNIEEQQKIGSFFKQLDNTIALHQRKLDLLKEQKKGYLQKMFPKNGAKVPELRFAGFADDWEERKLIDVKDNEDRYSYTGGPFGSDLKSSDYTEIGVRIIQLQNIGDGKFVNDYKIYTSEEKARSLNSNLIYPGEIIIAKMADPLARATILPKIEPKYLMASDGIRLKINTDYFDNYYILTLINSDVFRKEALNNSTGTTRKRIGLVTLGNLPMMIPSFEEQQQIGSLFKQIDDTIALHQRKLDLLKEQKKGYLQKMFV
ncbi:restriction endonuclease subunit S [Weissella paramesenteroides]|uniref:restriction endonuclease subunit S n=1 Tax=Weissella paramesenteroides TaxID=1249 RepID=UPI00112C9102|nr:restriction endonuclease subunit S [Weissella paramesenteroides]TPF00969.1 restriction endonuclease subunit S [Weissella paramesenteroides]